VWFSDTWTYTLPGFVAAGLNDELQQPVNQIGWERAKSQRILLAAEEEALPSGASLLPCYNSTGTEAM
jgi:hypothetical protein